MRIEEKRSGDWSPGLTSAEREALFSIALDSLRHCTAGGGKAFAFDAYDCTAALQEPMATFVTLHKQGRLRGCIGTLSPEAPLYRSVHDNACAAALQDPRFEPLQETELPFLRVDVSILSPIEPVPSVSSICLGAHGIILQKRGRRAVYLPEVATEQGWTLEETLDSLSVKAGLVPEDWRQGASFQVFSSVVLSDSEKGGV